MKLSEAGKDRDNNFSLIRILAALVVVYGHSFNLTATGGGAEPIEKLLHFSPVVVAVDIFFITSGFLVAGSLLKRQSTIDFVLARILRIYPALLVNVFLTVFGIGLAFSTLSAFDYLTQFQTYKFMVQNSLLVFRITYDLPGVFHDNPFPNAINGSLWTLPIEILVYAILAAAWLLPARLKQHRLRLFRATIIAIAVAFGALDVSSRFAHFSAGHVVHLGYMFFAAASFYVLKEKTVLSRTLFWIFVLALAASMLNRDAYFVVYRLTLPYCLLYLAYVPGGIIREYNKLGDCSYGTYIYAFPVQQTVAHLFPGISVPTMFVASTLVIVLLAMTSWHLIEKRALGFKSESVRFTRQLLHSH